MSVSTAIPETVCHQTPGLEANEMESADGKISKEMHTGVGLRLCLIGAADLS